MKLRQLKSHLNFNRSQRVGILLLLTLLTGLLYINFFVSFSEERTFDTSSAKIVDLLRKVDSLRLVEIEGRKPKLYPFNPNFITDFKAYTLGMTPVEFDRLKEFREKDQWINSIADFKRVTKVPDSILEKMSPLFKFPEWVTNPRPRKKRYNWFTSNISFSEKTDLNKATPEELQEVSGVGEILSNRIVRRREKLGGFSHDLQLYDIWGLKPEVVQRTLFRFTVKTPQPIIKMNINASSVSDLATIPGVSFEMGKKIWEFVRLREGVEDLSELLKIEGITLRKLELIELYLSAD
jgi:DNA uptake protein ComE-like DNA-binding protein